MHSGEETNLWVLINGLVPFTNYTVQVNVSNSQGSLMSDPVMISMPPGGKSAFVENLSVTEGCVARVQATEAITGPLQRHGCLIP